MRSTVIAVVLAAVLLIALQVFQLVRFDTRTLERSAEILLERARQVRERAHPGYQAEILASLSPNPFNGPSYRFDDQLANATGKVNSDRSPLASGVIFGFEFENSALPDLKPAEGLDEFSVRNGILEVRHSGNDYLTHPKEIQVAKDEIGEIAIRARLKRGKRMLLGWYSEPPSEKIFANRLAIDVVPDGEFHVYVLNMKNVLKRGLGIGEDIKGVVLRASNVPNDVVEIDYIRFISKLATYQREPWGTSYETIGGELRRVLYMLPSSSLEYSLRVPEGSPTLDFGTAILRGDRPVEFSVTVADGREKETVFSQRVDAGDHWSDHSISLARWSHTDVRVTLAVEGPPDNVALWSNPTLYTAPKSRFNVIIYLEDTLRADHLSTYGYTLPTAPVKDELSKEGVLFLKAVSQATLTRPSIPALMTSLHPTATGVWNFSERLAEQYLTLAEILRSQGFATASFPQNGNAGPYAGQHQGFGRLFDEWILGKTTEGVVGEHLMSWLDRNAHRNFFLYIHTTDPHGPFDPPPPYDSLYREAGPGGTPVERRYLDPEWVENPTLESRKLLYDGEIQHNDALFGTFLAKLDTLGLREDTLLIFISDHGEHLGEHGLWRHHPPGYLKGIHVPMILVYPRRFRGGMRITQNVQLVDVMPTVLELARVDRDALALHGDSLVDLIEGRNRSYWDDRVTISNEVIEMNTRDEPCDCGSVFFRNWHLINSSTFFFGSPHRWYRLPGLWQTFWLKVFDSDRDPEESSPVRFSVADLYLRYAYHRIVGTLHEHNIEAWRSWTGGSTELVEFDPDVQERLKALGYIQ